MEKDRCSLFRDAERCWRFGFVCAHPGIHPLGYDWRLFENKKAVLCGCFETRRILIC